MNTSLFLQHYTPDPQKRESIIVYHKEEDRKFGNGYICKRGIVRKGIAIAEDENNLFLIKLVPHSDYIGGKNYPSHHGIILFQQPKPDPNNNSKHHQYSLYRTLSGNYVLEDNFTTRKYIPGKDDEYEDVNYTFFTEDGKFVSSEYNDESNRCLGPIPIEITENIVRVDNTFYDSDSFEIIFTLPGKFKVEGCLDQNLIYLSVPEDNKQFYVLVKDGKIIKQYSDLTLQEIIEDLLEQEEATIRHLTGVQKRHSTIENKYIEKVYNDVSGFIQSNSYGEEIYHHGYTILDEDQSDIFTFEDEYLPSSLTTILNNLNRKLRKDQLVGTTKNKRPLFKISENLYCYVNRNFFLISKQVKGDRNHVLFTIYDYNGKKLTNSIYVRVNIPRNIYGENLSSNSSYFCDIFEGYNYQAKKKVAFGIYNNEFFETTISNEIHICKSGYNDYYLRNDKTDESYDLFLNPLKLTYINCRVNEEIQNYLYVTEPQFYTQTRDYHTGSIFAHINNVLFIKCNSPEPVIRGNKLCLPFPKSFKSCLDEIQSRNNNRPNFIENITKIGDFYTKEGNVTLYLFNCCPWAYCNDKGDVFYSFDKNSVIL